MVMHIRMLDKTAQLQQEAVGVLGINLIHAAFNKGANTAAIIGSLLDELSRSRVEVACVLQSTDLMLSLRLCSLHLWRVKASEYAQLCSTWDKSDRIHGVHTDVAARAILHIASVLSACKINGAASYPSLLSHAKPQQAIIWTYSRAKPHEFTRRQRLMYRVWHLHSPS